MSEEIPSWVINPEIPSVARMYDYYLGGKDNFASDRSAAEKIITILPNARHIARANRAFLGRAVRHLASIGFRQFLDIGTGLPSQENVHQVVHRVNPEAEVIYVDNDPIVLVHARAMLADNPRTRVIDGDMREPKSILTHPDLTKRLDLTQPLAVLMIAVVHFISDDDEASRVVSAFAEPLVPGSALALTHITAGDLDDDEVQQGYDVYRATAAGGIVPRTIPQVRGYFDGFDVLDPGVLSVTDWRPDPDQMPLPPMHGIGFVGGVGIKR